MDELCEEKRVKTHPPSLPPSLPTWNASPPLIRIPSRAPTPVPTITAVGVARPRAQGQATVMTEIQIVRAKTRGVSSRGRGGREGGREGQYRVCAHSSLPPSLPTSLPTYLRVCNKKQAPTPLGTHPASPARSHAVDTAVAKSMTLGVKRHTPPPPPLPPSSLHT